MIELPKWAMGDPAIVAEHLEGIRNRPTRQQRARERMKQSLDDLFSGESMTTAESDQIEDLLLIWYEWARRYRPALGAPRVSPYGRGSGGDAYGQDSDELDARIAADKAAAVDVCLNELTWQQRSAVGIHIANKAAGAAVYKNPRISPEDHHRAYQTAKAALLPMLRKRGMLRIAA